MKNKRRELSEALMKCKDKARQARKDRKQNAAQIKGQVKKLCISHSQL